MPSDRIDPLVDCPDCYGRPRGECPNCGARGIDPLSDSGDGTARRLHATTDAMVWAEEFCRIFAGRTIHVIDSDDGVDPGVMVGWFANAIAVGHDARLKEAWEEVEGHQYCPTCGLDERGYRKLEP